MFVQRIMTTLILVPLVLWLIFYGNYWLLSGVVLLIFLLASRECLQLIPLRQRSLHIGFVAFMCFCLFLCASLFVFWLDLGLIVWGFIILAVLTFPGSQQYWGYPVVVAATFLLLLPLMVQSLIHLYNLPDGKTLLVYLLCLIWVSDSGAYLCGKYLGKHKLIPQVSPGKSWEGVLAGIGSSMIIAGLACSYFNPISKIVWFTLALSTVLVAIFGDLFISILKRRCHLKDTGVIIPGHGGLLDRLDSLIVALPFFYYYVPSILR